jgi:hypothetical protein
MERKRAQLLREECYNCYHLLGSFLAPGCAANRSPANIYKKEICDRYSPINAVSEKEKEK